MGKDQENLYCNFADLLELLEHNPHKFEVKLITKAYNLAKESHLGQKRISGEEYILHPISVAKILVELGMDTSSIVAALLHDVVEDTDIDLIYIKREFGEEIANLVDGVTKLGKIKYSSYEEAQAENLRKMLIAMSADIRVIIIKLADRLHNMRTIDCMRPQKQRDKSLENMQVYAPIAHRLGIRSIKEELEDISLKYLDFEAYKEIEEDLEYTEAQREIFIERIKGKLREKLPVAINTFHIEGRVKSIYGIYRKMFMNGLEFEEIFDVYAVRVIVDTVNDCYNVLGVIHDVFQPIPNRFKDYIATPKPNFYQSLHSTVIGEEGLPFEVQIRTWEMHHTAEYGIAAHWKYKLGIKGESNKMEERLMWIKNIIENQKESGDALDLIRTIKSDLVPEEVFVLTPHGKVINLPTGATVIDFAYAIHSEVGNKMIGAKVDRRIVPFDYKVKTGQIIEILTTKDINKGPNRDWLKIVHTSEAKHKIRTWFKKEKKEENIAEGKSQIEKEFRRLAINLSGKNLEDFLYIIAKKHKFESTEIFYEAIGYGGVNLNRLFPSIKEDYNKMREAIDVVTTKIVPEKNIVSKPVAKSVIIEGVNNCLVKFAKCCNPIPGDDIIGFITRGYGVSIHKKSCSNVPQNFKECDQKERWVEAKWASTVSEKFRAKIRVFSSNRAGILADVTGILSNMKIFINSLNSFSLEKGNAVVEIFLTVENVAQLTDIIAKLSKIKSVISVKRV